MVGHSLSVIVSSYEQPNALRLVLSAFAAQTDTEFDLVVADDGSEAESREVIAAFAASAPFPVRFITQEHAGFRKARILNEAVIASTGRQVLFCDGDCVPFRNLVAVHRSTFRPGVFCAGGCIYLTAEQSRALTPEGVAAGAHERLLSPAHRRYLSWVHWKNVFHRLTGKKYKPRIRGANVSVDRARLDQIDGFDEEYGGFGGEDSDLRNRLRNAGARGICIWHRAVVMHLDHSIDPRRLVPGARRGARDDAFYYARRDRTRASRGMSAHRPAN